MKVLCSLCRTHISMSSLTTSNILHRASASALPNLDTLYLERAVSSFHEFINQGLNTIIPAPNLVRHTRGDCCIARKEVTRLGVTS
jgi:hypothetical protein